MTEDNKRFVSTATCQAIVNGHDREIKDLKNDVEKLDSRIWWIVGTGVLTFIMSGITLWSILSA